MVSAIASSVATTVQKTVETCWEKSKLVTRSILDVVRRAFQSVAAFFSASSIQRKFTGVVDFFFGKVVHVPKSAVFHNSRPKPFVREAPAASNPSPNLEGLLAILKRGKGGFPDLSSIKNASDFSTLCSHFPISVRIKEGNYIVERISVRNALEGYERLAQYKLHHREAGLDSIADRIEMEMDFPKERLIIGQWAVRWAKSKTISVDPTHRFFEIFQELFKRRKEIEGGLDSSMDYRTYHPYSFQEFSSLNPFTYIVHSLIGFQELDRKEHIILFHDLDNCKTTRLENPAYEFATELSRIFTYPNAVGAWTDVRHKLQKKMDA